MLITVRDRRGFVAEGEVQVHDVYDDGEVVAAGKRVCKAEGLSLPADARIAVAEARGSRWSEIREVIA